MAKIFYGLAGEGRGHATRATTITEHLRREHEVVLFAPDQAFAMLSSRYRHVDGVEVVEIEGPRFRYDRHGRVDKLRTALSTFGYMTRLRRIVGTVVRRMRIDRPDLCITDFDPVVPRAAETLEVPYVSVDHQHFLVVSDFSALPRRSRRWAAAMSPLVRAYYRRQQTSIVSSFHFPPLKRRWRDRVVQTGVLLRPEMEHATPEHGSHLCVYLRRFATPAVLGALKASGIEARIYGVGDHGRDGNLVFQSIDERRFLEDLATCRGLVSTAGNQLVGEAHWLGKPVLAMPEPGNEEQSINAWFVSHSGAGVQHDLDTVTAADVRRFAESADELRNHIDRRRLNGNDATLRAIREALGEDHQDAVTPSKALAAS